MKNVFSLLHDASSYCPKKLFLEDPFSSYFYLEAYQTVLSVASSLRRKGIFHQPILVKAAQRNETVLSFLSIAASGNYYIPVDPNIPEEKLASILEQSGCMYALILEGQEEIEGLNNLPFASLKDEKEPFAYEDFEANFNEEDPLCLLFTSGSTGKPKGVLKSQRSFLAFTENFAATFPDIKSPNIANQTPLFFDASEKDIYLTLALQGSLFLTERSLFSFPMKLIEFLNEKQINFLCWVPSALTIIAKMKALNYDKPKYLRHVFFVGEIFLPKYLNVWTEALPETHFINLYGSTEIAGVCLYHEVKGHLEEDELLPTGKPLLGNEVYLEDGEICINSRQIASGYLHDEEKNAKTFVKSEKGIILHTGDYAHIDNNGDIVFESRKDYQIKHMGYRIELQEIEVAISSFPYIDSCCCLYDKGKDRIVLFASINVSMENPSKQILLDCQSKLANYMRPTRVEILEAMPLNANGKIDRAALQRRMEQ